MGTNHSSSPSFSKNSSSTNSSLCTPEKEISSSKISAEELIQSANNLIETGRRVVKEFNETQYSAYNLLGYQNRLSKQHSIAEDLRYLISNLENSDQFIQQYENYKYYCQSNKDYNLEVKQVLEEMSHHLAKVEILIKLASQARSSLLICQNLILKSQQMIEYIEIIESREKKIIRQKGLKKQLDQAQVALNDTSLILQTYLVQKLQIETTNEIDRDLFKLQKIRNNIHSLMSRFQVEDEDITLHEIPCELE